MVYIKHLSHSTKILPPPPPSPHHLGLGSVIFALHHAVPSPIWEIRQRHDRREKIEEKVLYKHMSFARMAEQDFLEATILNLDLKCFATFQEMKNREEAAEIPPPVTRWGEMMNV